ncbi:MAG: DNA-directed RNA polymerase subunit alpha [Dysgonamonadaceae bacterium]|jgi:DNA-directed RNA polymerase subunit alpha|nr:DNA-directed RNA polymerase subunit alpha [Dysgonamonadaceae bacterium]
MEILSFQKPDRVLMLESDNTFGRFEFRPLEPGYGITIGNALRRVLLSSLEGFAISSIKIDGISNEFETIPGVMEDVTNIILNLKKVRFKQVVKDTDTEKATIIVSNTEEFTAEAIGRAFSGFSVLNPDLVICRLNRGACFTIELTVIKGRGYVPAEENRYENAPANLLFVDSIFTPIRNVKYWREDFRVDQKTDYDKLVIEVTTDGSILPQDALKAASRILIYHFTLFSEDKIHIETSYRDLADGFDEDTLHARQLMKTRLADVGLSVRALNCLKAAGVETLSELLRFQKNDLLKFRNFGRKSLVEIDELLEKLKLNFGMDLSKYKLDRDN